MKTFKMVLLFVFLATVWLNVGYYVEKSKYEADVKYLSGARLNTLEKFQMGPNYHYAPKDPKVITEHKMLLWRGMLILVWPVLVLVWVGAWMVKGVIIAALAVWYGLVWLFRFVFCGGFFRLIGLRWTIFVLLLLLLSFVAWLRVRSLNKLEKK